MSSIESESLCRSPKGAEKIANELDKGNGDAAKKMLNECLASRLGVDAASNTALHQFENATTKPKMLDAEINYSVAAQKVQTELWQSVQAAQGKDSSGLCKLDLTMDGKVATKVEIIGKNCKQTTYQLR
jgi:hypothetical protein